MQKEKENASRQEKREAVNRRDIRELYNFKKSAKGLYCCPICNSGEGKNKTGALQISPDGSHITCYSGKCFGGDKGEDVLGALRRIWDTDENGVFDRVLGADAAQIQRSDPSPAPKKEKTEAEAEADKAGIVEYVKRQREALATAADGMLYLRGRGLTEETAKRCGVGYDPVKRCIVIPYDKEGAYYITRSIDAKEYRKPPQSTAGKEPVYNAHALYDGNGPEVVFVVESPFCAMSIMQGGGAAIAIGGTGAGKLLDLIESARTTKTLALALDNDEAGQKAQAELSKKLDEAKIEYLDAKAVSGKYKDPNERLQADVIGFYADVKRLSVPVNAKPDNILGYIANHFSEDIKKNQEGKKGKTGFKLLDDKIGSIYAGLYVIGAISSLGKTTFVHQMCDQIAEAGEDVLFFSLEQSRLEMVTKSVSRVMAQKNEKTAKTSLQIRNGDLTQEVRDAVEEYQKRVGDRISVVEGNFDTTTDTIRDKVKAYKAKTGKSPLVVVDYLQILTRQGDRMTDKEKTDLNMVDLKRLSRDLNIPVFVISSLNRANYSTQADFESFKESGGIEYTADVVFAMQLSVLEDPIFDKQGSTNEKREKIILAKRETPRKIHLVCLKNRYGETGFTVPLLYKPRFDLFECDYSQQAQKAYFGK